MTVTNDIYLEVNTVPLHTYAWRHLDVLPILADAVRGSDLAIPLVDGVRPYPRRRTSIEVTLPMRVFGTQDQNGTPIADPWAGVISNFLTLKAGLGIGLTTGDGTVTATLHTPTTSYSADVHVLGFPQASWQATGVGVLNTALDLSIPSGLFTEDP